MPIYEYRCNSCGFQKEYIQRMSDALLTDCPECKQATFSKMVTAAGFQLKGGGWYVTDFKGSGSKPAAAAQKTEAKSSDSGEKSASSKTESSSAEPAKAEKPKTETAAPSTGASTGTT